MHYVVGSGPSGTACAKALLDRGLSVTMIDAGIDLEPEQVRHRDRLAASVPNNWPSDSLDAVKAGMEAGPGGVPLKRVFGSDFPFREPAEATPLRQENARALRSFAAGGLSRAWGATLLPAAAEDIRHWPISSEDLVPHYEAVMQWVPLSAARDGLSALFPLYSEAPGDLRPSRQARSILSDLDRHRDALFRQGVIFGRARLAVRSRPEGDRLACVNCRLCLYGCPYGCIYSADQMLDVLVRHPRFTYCGHLLVKGVRETADGAQLDAVDLADGRTRSFSGERIFLACGVLTTSQLLMDALGLAEVSVQTSQSFLLPLVRTRAERRVREDESHALSQVYLLLRDLNGPRRLTQLQIYTYSDLISTALRSSLVGPVLRLCPPLMGAVEDRLVVLQGLLPSEESDPLSLRRTPGGFVLKGRLSSGTRGAIDRVARAVRAIGSLAHFLPLTPLLRTGTPGQSFHTGASFPMSTARNGTASDLLGRAGGLRRIHAVDATVLPDIPAPPLTLTVMANAHRIGSCAG